MAWFSAIAVVADVAYAHVSVVFLWPVLWPNFSAKPVGDSTTEFYTHALGDGIDFHLCNTFLCRHAAGR